MLLDHEKWGLEWTYLPLFALRNWLIAVFSLYTSLHYINGRCLIVVAVNSPTRVSHGNARTFSQNVIGSIVNDSRCRMRDVAFRTAPPIGDPSCFLSLQLFLVYSFQQQERVIAESESNRYVSIPTTYRHLFHRVIGKANKRRSYKRRIDLINHSSEP